MLLQKSHVARGSAMPQKVTSAVHRTGVTSFCYQKSFINVTYMPCPFVDGYEWVDWHDIGDAGVCRSAY